MHLIGHEDQDVGARHGEFRIFDFRFSIFDFRFSISWALRGVFIPDIQFKIKNSKSKIAL